MDCGLGLLIESQKRGGESTMLKPIAFANAVAAVIGGIYFVCAALTYIAPDLILGIGQSWMHAINLEAIRTTASPSVGGLVWGFVSAVLAGWVSGYALAYLNNRFSK
jgi:hypothetical protein